ncbi:MAG TPA: PQQ-binding-like beta-propeller repeat protein [Lacipirellulaceae bacterium]|nr:PQQ-binding-like beta-propeller repeat protein [Lacipirellulaceae bacterium]
MRNLLGIALCLVICPSTYAEDSKLDNAAGESLSLVVMDPLAAPLSCPCVEGYAQRQYDKLGEYLTERLGRPVQVTFAESFEKALAKENCKTIDIAIGKDSVVRHDAAAAKMKVTPLAQLSGKDGITTQTGLIVVRSADPAQKVEDLRGYRILFGTTECDEKFSAPRAMLASAGVEFPAVDKSETTQSCSDGACKIIEWGNKEKAAAVISSYAAPLLEGCGTIKKGDLRVVAETEPVPFITAFTTDRVDDALRTEIREALLEVGMKPEMATALETLVGFVEIDDEYHELLEATARQAAREVSERPATTSDQAEATRPVGSSRPDDTSTSAWPGWRGPTRDGRVASLPSALPKEPAIVWRQALHRPGLGGIAATENFVVLGDRDISNTFDEFRCYAAGDGELLWTVQYPAPGKLDYDNTPRATPLIHEGHVYLLGAFGDLLCVELESGVTLWQMNLINDFGGDSQLVWGTCSSPLVVDGKLIVNPGGPDASIVALDPLSGEVVWQTPGDQHAYSSFIVATLGGVRQLVGYDRTSLGGWDIETGTRLWTLKPPFDGDFNVPTPVAVDGKLLVATENNYARLYEFDKAGQIKSQPVAVNDRLGPDTSTPVVIGNRAFCVRLDMFCLDVANGLKPIWIGEDKAFCDYSPLIASDDRVLAVGAGGELILVDAAADEFRIVSRLKLFGDDSSTAEVLAHPALVGTRLYFRGEKELVCVELSPDAASN